MTTKKVIPIIYPENIKKADGQNFYRHRHSVGLIIRTTATLYLCGADIMVADKGKMKLYVSSFSFSNLNHLLSRQYSQKDARRILNKFKVLVNVLGVGDKIIDLYLNSESKDFEYARQY